MSDLATHLRDTGMALASEAQEAKTPGFSAHAYAAIVLVARRQPTVHVDDVLATCEAQPEHANAWGAVWARAIRDGVIRRSGEVRLCRSDPRKHRHAYPVYKSSLYRKAAKPLAHQIEMFGGGAP